MKGKGKYQAWYFLNVEWEKKKLMEVSPTEKVLRVSLFVDMIARKTTFRCLSSITIKTAR